MAGRRLVPISGELFQQILTAGNMITVKCTSGLPKDAKFINYGYDAWSDKHLLVFESAEWEQTDPGSHLEQIEVIYEAL